MLAALNFAGVNGAFPYVRLRQAPAGQTYGRFAGGFEVTEGLSERLVRQPLWAAMEDADIEHVLDTLRHVLSRWHLTALR